MGAPNGLCSSDELNRTKLVMIWTLAPIMYGRANAVIPVRDAMPIAYHCIFMFKNLNASNKFYR